MDVTILSTPYSKSNSYDIIVLPVFEDFFKSSSKSELTLFTKNMIDNGYFKGTLGNVYVKLGNTEADNYTALILLGLGKKDHFDGIACRTAFSKLAKQSFTKKEASIHVLNSDELVIAPITLSDFVAYVTEGILLGLYEFSKYKTTAVKRIPPKTVHLQFNRAKSMKNIATVVKKSNVLAKATNYAKDLVNEPSDVMHPKAMMDEALNQSGKNGIQTKIFTKANLQKLHMNGILSVGSGGAHDPAMSHMTYTPKNKKAPHIVIIGKGITFDSGGINVKTYPGMLGMNHDMAGAAAVLGIFQALGELNVPYHVTGLFAAVENLIDRHSYVPNNVIKSMSGKTVEVLNTDAEGRLVLMDLLHYAGTLSPKPDVMIDMATLTGACVAALGEEIAGLFSNNGALTRDLITASKKAGEKLWELPLDHNYAKSLKSPIADISNVAMEKTPGAITAGLFLQEFVDPKIPWVHLDTAGPADPTKAFDYHPKGGTGFGVRTLLEYLLA